MVAAGRCAVDIELGDTTTDSRDGGDGHANSHALDAAETDSEVLEQRVDNEGKDGREEDDRQGVEVVEQIIRRAVEGHGSGQVGGRSPNATVVEVVDGDVQEDLACRPGTADVSDKAVIPASCLPLLSQSGGPGSIPEALLPDHKLVLLAADQRDLEELAELGAHRGLLDDSLFNAEEDDDDQAIHDCRKKVCQPVTDIALCVGTLREGVGSVISWSPQETKITRKRTLFLPLALGITTLQAGE